MAKDSLRVVDDDQSVPFLRGMLTHSLIKRGLPFRKAYDTANLVRTRIRSEGEIAKEDLSRVIEEILQEQFGNRYPDQPQQTSPRFLVVWGKDSIPFSKGIISQSLQASGLQPEAAYSIAMQIEETLLERGEPEVGRDELREMIYQAILSRHNRDFAERYLQWRYFRSPDQPIVILFGGGTGTGKTSLATEVAHRLGIKNVISTDTIREIMRMMFSPELLPAIHRSSYDAWKEVDPLDPEPTNAVLVGFRDQTDRVLVGVRAMLERAIQENTSMVIDGVHLVPGLMDLQDLKRESYLVQIVISTLKKSNYLRRFPRRQGEALKRSAQRYQENFDAILTIQNFILSQADNHDVPIVDNRGFEETVASLLTVITTSLREQLKVDHKG